MFSFESMHKNTKKIILCNMPLIKILYGHASSRWIKITIFHCFPILFFLYWMCKCEINIINMSNVFRHLKMWLKFIGKMMTTNVCVGCYMRKCGWGKKGTISFQMIGLASVVVCLCVFCHVKVWIEMNGMKKKYGNVFKENSFFRQDMYWIN